MTQVIIHSRFSVEVCTAERSVWLEYDDAADFLDAIEHEPHRADELAALAVDSFA